MRAVLALILAAAALPAAAAPVTVDIRARATSGPSAGEVLRGSFTFDDSSLMDGEGFDVPLIGLTGDFRDYNDSIAPVGLPFIIIDGRTVVDFIFGGAPSGFDSVDAADPVSDFLLDPVGLVYYLAGEEFLGFGDIEYIAAPAPAALALFGLGAAALGFRRRR